ncbi:3'-5' exonuclease [Roseivirga sp. 4D4]|uniref:3'-5' exonuclease n=1 Tax=Roseivirga sp. 4D4 TaxID=1889784 RepID=UPI00147D66A8|nr:3'-5' exonuclease [Roseivirga sp. 4D4]
MDRPLKSYEGKVVIAADKKSTERAMSEINEFDMVGFDTEAKPTFQKGQIRNISLIQVATEEKVYLLRTHHIGVIDSLHHFLENESIKKVGIGLLDDFNLLNRLRAFEPNGFIDLNDTFQELGAENIGARNLAAMVLDIRISKSAQTSNWEAEQLAQKQIKYAATDAWICLEIHNKLSQWGYV